MPARYAPLPNPPSVPDADRELNDAFGDDLDDANETTPFTTSANVHTSSSAGNVSEESSGLTNPPIPGAYDFEREYNYDLPPPGSPPRPTALALPNDIGNSNGLLPTSPIRIPLPRVSLFRRAVGAVGAILPTHYTRVPSEPTQGRVVGSGLDNDGVFANVTAKPQRAREVRTEDGDIYVVPEEAQRDVPPVREYFHIHFFPCAYFICCFQSYAAAQLDVVPPYWETTVHAPSGMVPGADMIIDDLPSGSVWIFALNLLISFLFQLVGFLLTYLLHTSHAAKYGSRAGLGLTLIQFGFYSRSQGSGSDGGATSGPITPPPSPFPTGQPMNASAPMSSESIPVSGGISSREWISFILMTFGKWNRLPPFLSAVSNVKLLCRLVYPPIIWNRVLARKALGIVHSFQQSNAGDS